MSVTPLCRYVADAIKEDILNQLRSGTLSPETRLPGERILAQKYQISYLTARKAIKELIASGILGRTAAGRLCAGPTALAQAVSCRTKLIAFIASDLNSPLGLSLLSAIEHRARQNHYLTIACNSQLDITNEAALLQNVCNNDVSGVILWPVISRTRHNIFDTFQQRRLPLVTVDHGIANDKIDLIESDNFDTAYRATSYLLSLGHTRIGHLTIPQAHFADNFVAQERFEGYRQALIDHGIPFRPELVGHMSDEFYDIELAKFNLEYMGFHATTSLLSTSSPPTALVLVEDELAYGVYLAAEKLHIPIPQKLSVIGINNLNVSQGIHPTLTTMALPFAEIGSRAAELLLARIAGNMTGPAVHERLKSSLALRQSTRALHPDL